jgi:hypothetical protein
VAVQFSGFLSPAARQPVSAFFYPIKSEVLSALARFHVAFEFSQQLVPIKKNSIYVC